MNKLEKPIDKPPILMSLSKSEAATDPILLWSLGIEGGAGGASLAVLYGRARTVGGILQGEDISEQKLFQVVATIGLNCECGLDRSWMQGQMIPMKWGASLQTRVAAALGFDAEDPKIKMEMSQILSKSGSGEGRRHAGDGQDLDAFLAGYAETSVDSTTTTRDRADDAPLDTGQSSLSLRDEEKEPGSNRNRITGLVVLSVAGLIVVASGVLIALKGNARNR